MNSKLQKGCDSLRVKEKIDGKPLKGSPFSRHVDMGYFSYLFSLLLSLVGIVGCHAVNSVRGYVDCS